MLGQLFSSLGPSFRRLSRQQSVAESYDVPLSVTEDAHTRSLLFPDPDILNRSHSEPYPLQGNTEESITAAYGAIYDNWNTEVGIDGSQDIRILIARDELGRLPKTIIYDSNPSDPLSPGVGPDRVTRRAPDSPGGSEPVSPKWKMSLPSPTSLSFHKVHPGRRFHGRSESSSFSSIFTSSPDLPGSGAFSRNHLRGSSISSIPETDIRKIKRDVKDFEYEMDDYMDCMFGNTAPSYKGPGMKLQVFPARTQKGQLRDIGSHNVVLVTRTFSLPIRDNRSLSTDAKTPLALPRGATQYLHEPLGPEGSGRLSSTQKRVLFYAVSVAIRMTSASPSLQTSPLQMRRQQSPTSPRSPEMARFSPNSFPTTDGSTNWSFGEDVDPSGVTDDFVLEVVTRHWDVIQRTLFCLQHDLQNKIVQANIRTPIGRSTDALQSVEVRTTIDKSISRIAYAINTARVATGQGRWGIWRDEARTIDRWAHSHLQNSFFHLLINTFLANHREWTEVMPDLIYRRKTLRRLRPDRPPENITLSSRTVLISRNKMTCRRLIFLLSAFLPTYRSYHPILSTHSSFKNISGIGTHKKSRPSKSALDISDAESSLPTGSFESYGGYLSPRGLLSREESEDQNLPKTDTGNAAMLDGMTTPNLPQADVSRKETSERSRRSSAVTSSKTATGATIPVSAFIPPSTRKTSFIIPDRRRGSSGSQSQASAKLLQSLRMNRSHSNTSDTASKNQIWHDSRRADVFDQSIPSPGLRRGIGSHSILGSSADSGGRRLQSLYQDTDLGASKTSSPTSPLKGRAPFSTETSPLLNPAPSMQRPVDRLGPSGIPYTMSVNAKDGVIDVDIPFIDLGAPLALSSMTWADSSSWSSKSHTSTSSPLFGSATSPSVPLRVAGWLKKFQPDWHLQAVNPYAELDQDIRSAMAAEPTNAHFSSHFLSRKPPKSKSMDEWIDVCSTVIADCDTFRVRRLVLRRLYRYVPETRIDPSNVVPQPSERQKAKTGQDRRPPPILIPQLIKEEIVEDALVETDETLVRAVNRILLRSLPSSQSHSRRPSRANSVHGASKETTVEGNAEPMPEILRRDCERLMLGSLDHIVKAAIAVLVQQNAQSQAVSEVEEEAVTPFTLHDQIVTWLKEYE